MDIFGVSVDTVEANKAFSEKFGFSFPLLCDTGKEMTRAFDACMAIGEDPCALSSRITVLVKDGIVKQVINPFDAKEGPKKLLDSLNNDGDL